MASVLEYMRAAMRHAQYEKSEDGYFATIPGLKGLWASGATIEDAREDLFSALDGWISIDVLVGQNKLPAFDDVSLYQIKKTEEDP